MLAMLDTGMPRSLLRAFDALNHGFDQTTSIAGVDINYKYSYTTWKIDGNKIDLRYLRRAKQEDFDQLDIFLEFLMAIKELALLWVLIYWKSHKYLYIKAMFG